jgi:exopolyphosphatase/guanosine-5'-triphosphate,3'-diphosphate pyrophosphatase
LYAESIESRKKESLAIIDLGYNSIKISTYDIYKNGHYKKQYQKQDYVQIGSELNSNDNIISGRNIDRTIKALDNFKKDLKEKHIDIVIPIATSAVREASNQKFVVNTLEDNTGFLFNILSGPEEGFFSYLGAQSYMHIPNGLFFDLGGGSLELMYVQDFRILKTICLDMGVLRLSEEFVNYNSGIEEDKPCKPWSDIRYKRLEKSLIENIPSNDQLSLERSSDTKMVAIGGTIRAIYKFMSTIMDLSPSGYHSRPVLDKRMITVANTIFRALSIEELSNLKSIDHERAKTITTGSFIVKILIDKQDFNNLLICPTGLREGVLEYYLYFKMDKKYRSRKKFIQVNCEPLFAIESSRKNILSTASYSTLSAPEPDSYIFPRKLNSIKVNKLKD